MRKVNGEVLREFEFKFRNGQSANTKGYIMEHNGIFYCNLGGSSCMPEYKTLKGAERCMERNGFTEVAYVG